MKKLIFILIIILIALGVIYKMDIKPQVKDVTKAVSVNTQSAPAPTQTPVNAAPSQNVQ